MPIDLGHESFPTSFRYNCFRVGTPVAPPLEGAMKVDSQWDSVRDMGANLKETTGAYAGRLPRSSTRQTRKLTSQISVRAPRLLELQRWVAETPTLRSRGVLPAKIHKRPAATPARTEGRLKPDWWLVHSCSFRGRATSQQAVYWPERGKKS